MICFIEVGLRTAGFIISGGKVVSADKGRLGDIRILTLGESTTDRRFLTKDNKAWPEYLEEMAKSRGLKVKVFNHGRAAITSNEILNDLDALLNHYKPHFVITMIGINDSDVWALKINKSFLARLKTYRLVSWTYWSIYNFFSYKPLDRRSFDKNQVNVKKLTKKEESQYYAFLAEKTTPILPLPINEKDKEEKYINARDFYKKSIETGHYTKGVLGHYLWLLSKFEDTTGCSRVVRDYVEKGGILNYVELMSAQSCLLEVPQSQSYLRENKENLNFSLVQNAGLHNYRRIHKKILDSKARHVVMQYPMMSIDELKKNIRGNSETIYIENYENFKSALEIYKDEDIFIDNFADDFGHTTKLGHKLIAKEVFKNLFPIFKAYKKIQD